MLGVVYDVWVLSEHGANARNWCMVLELALCSWSMIRRVREVMAMWIPPGQLRVSRALDGSAQNRQSEPMAFGTTTWADELDALDRDPDHGRRRGTAGPSRAEPRPRAIVFGGVPTNDGTLRSTGERPGEVRMSSVPESRAAPLSASTFGTETARDQARCE